MSFLYKSSDIYREMIAPFRGTITKTKRVLYLSLWCGTFLLLITMSMGWYSIINIFLYVNYE